MNSTVGKVLRIVGRVCLYTWMPILLICLWWYVPPRKSVYLPSLPVVLDDLRDNWLWQQASEALVPSLEVVGLGFAIAVAGGIILGLVLRLIPFAYELSIPVVSFFRGLPAIALIPPLLLIFGLGATFKVGIVVLGAIQPVLLNTLNGLQSVDRVQLDTADAYRVGGWRRVVFVLLPGASPQIVAGCRTALQVSILLMVASEIIGSTEGIGFVLVSAQQDFDGPGMWAAMLVLGVVGVVLNVLFVLAQRLVLGWYVGMRAREARGG
jgi:ABC-type nitrate/sulfonate/bicarbonate transport system permease component